MRAGSAASLLPLLLAARFCSAQAAYVEVKVPTGVRSETMFVRYVLDDDFGGWVDPHPDVSAYFIALRQPAPATRFRALLYAPGCAIQTLDLPVSGPAVPRSSFVCQPLPALRLAGALMNSGRLKGHDVSLQVKYVAPWAQSVLGLGDGVMTDIPIGETHHILADGTFELSLPDLSVDPLAGTPEHPGQLQILARDRATGKILAQLVPSSPSLRTRLGGLQIHKEYPAPIEFAFCAAQGPRLYDRNGFAIRPTPGDTCDY